jgi:hypothetical protein
LVVVAVVLFPAILVALVARQLWEVVALAQTTPLALEPLAEHTVVAVVVVAAPQVALGLRA